MFVSKYTCLYIYIYIYICKEKVIRQIGTFLLCYLFFNCSHLVFTWGHHQVFVKTSFLKFLKNWHAIKEMMVNELVTIYKTSSTTFKFICRCIHFRIFTFLSSYQQQEEKKKIYIYIYIYIFSSTDRLFCCITMLQCGQTYRMLQAGIETCPTLH